MFQIVLAMKAVEENFSQNALKSGVAGINIDGCRINPGEVIPGGGNRKASHGGRYGSGETSGKRPIVKPHSNGRWPANVMLKHHTQCEMMGIKEVKSDGHWIAPTDSGLYKLGVSNDGRDEGNKLASDGKEEVEDWDCHVDCQVRKLDEQSGLLKSGKPSGTSRFFKVLR